MKKLWNKIWSALRSDGQLCFGVVGILVLLFIVAAAPVLTSHDPYFYGPDSLAAPGVNGHLLGTNHMGQDVVSMLLYGVRTSLMVAVVSSLISGVLGVLIGGLGGYFGGKVDLVVSEMSYGGFMTLSCATRLPELWCCAIDTVGMYNLETFLENTAEYRRAHRESEYGSLAHHRHILREVSPIAKIDDIQAPLMVIQGRNDPRVPAEEAEQVVGTLRERGHVVEYLCYEDEGHGIGKLKNQLDCYPRMAAFLKKYMKLS